MFRRHGAARLNHLGAQPQAPRSRDPRLGLLVGDFRQQVIERYRRYVLDILRERASGLFIDDPEVLDLIAELAQILRIGTHDAAQVLYEPYRAVLNAMDRGG